MAIKKGTDIKKGTEIYIISKSAGCGIHEVRERCKRNGVYKKIMLKAPDGKGVEAFLGYYNGHSYWQDEKVHIIDYYNPPGSGDYYKRKDFMIALLPLTPNWEYKFNLPEELFEI